MWNGITQAQPWSVIAMKRHNWYHHTRNLSRGLYYPYSIVIPIAKPRTLKLHSPATRPQVLFLVQPDGIPVGPETPISRVAPPALPIIIPGARRYRVHRWLALTSITLPNYDRVPHPSFSTIEIPGSRVSRDSCPQTMLDLRRSFQLSGRGQQAGSIRCKGREGAARTSRSDRLVLFSWPKGTERREEEGSLLPVCSLPFPSTPSPFYDPSRPL